MENYEANSIQQEIIEKIATKVTGLEKWQSKIDGLKLAAIPSQVEELETKVAETAEMRTLENTKQLDRFDKQLTGFDEKVNAIPKEIPIKYKVEFDTKAKFVIRTILGMGLAVAIMLAISINLWMENNRMAEETNKFLILRGFYPGVARSIDSAYVVNADTLIKKSKANIVEQQAILQAAIEAQQAADQSKQAKEKYKKLKGRVKTGNNSTR